MKVLRSKLLNPQPAPHHILRPRLIKQFLASSTANLFLLIAPAGFGKTTLALQVLSKIGSSPHAWLHLDSQDIDPGRFLTYLTEALAHVMPEVKSSGLQGKAASLPAAELADELCCLVEQSKRPTCWLVLDNWETVNDSKEHADVVLRLAAAGQRKLRIVLASRVKPAFSTRKLQESGGAVIIGKDELAFTFSEFIDAVRNRTPVDPDNGRVEQLWQQTAGWCVSIGLLLESLKHRPAMSKDEMFTAGKSLRSFTEYVEEELLRGMPSDLVRFLARCSVLDVISPDSAATVMGEGNFDIERNLRSLGKSAIPHVALDQPETFRLHPLVRQAFNQILRNTSTRDELSATYQCAARYFRKQGAILEATQLLMDLPDYAAALQAIDEDWHAIVAANGLNRVRVWLEQFPANLVKIPLYVKIRTQQLSISGENRKIVEYLSDKLDPELYGDNFVILGNLWIHYHWALLHLSPATGYDSTRREWQALKNRCGDFGKSIEAGVHVVLSLAAHQELREEKAIEHSKACLSVLDEKQFDYRMTMKSNIAMFMHFQGKSQEALDRFKEILAECEGKSAFTIVPMVLTNIAEVHVAWGNYRRALESADHALQILASYGMHNRGVEMYIDRCRGIASWYLGDTEEAIGFLNRSHDTSLEYDEWERLSVALWLDYFRLLLGEGARPRIDAAASLGKRTEPRLLWLGREAVRAALADKWPALGKQSADLRKLAETTNSQAWKVTACFLKAIWADGGKKQVLARQFLRAGLRQLGGLGYFSYPMANDFISSFVISKSVRYNMGTDSARLLLKGDHQLDLTTAFIKELESRDLTATELRRLLLAAAELQVRGLATVAGSFAEHDNPAVAAAGRHYLNVLQAMPLPPLTIRMLGGFSVVAGGRRVVFGRKKSRQLLQLLLLEKCGPIHEEVIVEALWPGSDPAKSKPILQTCIKDLRRALDPYHDAKGKSYVVYSDEHYSLEIPGGSTVDTFEFENLLMKAGFHGAEPLIRSQDQEACLRSAAAIYQGELLPEERFEAYAVEYRERLLHEFLELSVALARFLVDKGKIAEAIAALERGLQFDPLWGEGVREMMTARVKNGELYRAFQTYRAYEQRLQQDFAVSPDQSLTAYFDELVASMTQS